MPLQLGSRSLSYPRLAAFGFWAWASGLIITLAALGANGGPGGGNSNMVDLYLLALGLVAQVWYFVRAPHRRQVDEIYARVLEIAQGAAFVAIVPVLGFVVSIGLFVAAVAYYAGARDAKTLLWCALITGPMLWLSFDYALEIHLPTGMWSQWIGK